MFNALRQASKSATLVRVARRPATAASPLRTFQSVRTVVTKRYTQDHEAVVFDDSTGVGTVAITDYAQSSLGDVVFVELPTVGSVVNQGDQIGAVESVKAASDIYAPVSGTVKEINEELNSQPGLLNKSPEGDGWLCKIELSDTEEITKLMTEDAYKEHCEH
ncbi:single hybrid motif-containing protein [Cristinia sonorae]|uniref:Glycine cleavage system H protein n=1 Tax=Cristinia sonorae TaxID=1940300 RepID=A0A8K0UTS0_9AGAR|nr:single hybrid motif-containing protein [Cristinia sonorae]